jgi:hypothetical protein
VDDHALLEETMLHIRTYPELHNQSVFFEKTELGLAACFAGRACLLAGLDVVLHAFGVGGSVVYNDQSQSAFTAARDLLGLTHDQARNLFTPLNTTQMLEWKVKDLVNGLPLQTYRECVLEPA